MTLTTNRTYSSSSTATVDSRQSKGASIFALRINSRDFFKNSFSTYRALENRTSPFVYRGDAIFRPKKLGDVQRPYCTLKRRSPGTCPGAGMSQATRSPFSKREKPRLRAVLNGGDKGSRTPDLLNAISQQSKDDRRQGATEPHFSGLSDLLIFHEPHLPYCMHYVCLKPTPHPRQGNRITSAKRQFQTRASSPSRRRRDERTRARGRWRTMSST